MNQELLDRFQRHPDVSAEKVTCNFSDVRVPEGREEPYNTSSRPRKSSGETRPSRPAPARSRRVDGSLIRGTLARQPKSGLTSDYVNRSKSRIDPDQAQHQPLP